MPLCLVGLGGISIALLSSTSAIAQMDMMAPLDAVGAYNAGQTTRRLLERSNDPASQPTSVRSGSDNLSQVLTDRLRFKPSPTVSQQVNQAVADLLSGENTVQRDLTLGKFEPVLISQPEFRSLLAK